MVRWLGSVRVEHRPEMDVSSAVIGASIERPEALFLIEQPVSSLDRSIRQFPWQSELVQVYGHQVHVG